MKKEDETEGGKWVSVVEFAFEVLKEILGNDVYLSYLILAGQNHENNNKLMLVLKYGSASRTELQKKIKI